MKCFLVGMAAVALGLVILALHPAFAIRRKAIDGLKYLASLS